MKKIVFAILAMLIFSSAAEAKKKYAVKVGDFTTLRVEDNVRVYYHCNADSAGQAVVYANDAQVNSVMFTSNKKGKLTIQADTDAILSNKVPTVHVYSSFLQMVENDSDSTLTLVSLSSVPELKLKLTANGKIATCPVKVQKLTAQILTGRGIIEVKGKCDEASLKNVGSGAIHAQKLEVKEKINCQIVGTGIINCNPGSNPLEIKGSGSGKVYYKGHPSKINIKQIGSIKALPLEE